MVTLLQFWLDSERKRICLQIAGEAKRSAELTAACHNIVINPPVSAEELAKSVLNGIPPAGPVTTALLRCWAHCEEPVVGGEFHFSEQNAVRTSGVRDQPFLSRVVGHGRRSSEVLSHFFANAGEVDAQRFLRKLKLQAEVASKVDVSRLAAPTIGKQIASAVRSYAISLDQIASDIFNSKEGPR